MGNGDEPFTIGPCATVNDSKPSASSTSGGPCATTGYLRTSVDSDAGHCAATESTEPRQPKESPTVLCDMKGDTLNILTCIEPEGLHRVDAEGWEEVELAVDIIGTRQQVKDGLQRVEIVQQLVLDRN